MELKGHKGQVMSVAFSPDNTRAVTVSKDLTLRVWNIDVRCAVRCLCPGLLTTAARIRGLLSALSGCAV